VSAGNKGGRLGLAIVIALCLLALGFLYQHSRSKALTREESALRTRCRLLSEEAESLGVEVVKLTTFARLDSVWVAQGRPGVAPAGDSTAGALAMAAGIDGRHR